MADTKQTGLPDDLGVVRAHGEMLVYEIRDDGEVSLMRCGEASPIPAHEQTAEMRAAVDDDLAKRGLKKPRSSER